MIKKIFILITLSLVLNLKAQSDQKIDQKKITKHFVGLHVGTTTGYGFSYRYWPTKLGVQITGIPIFTQNSYNVSTGFSLLYKLRDNNRIDLYSYLGNHLLFESNTNQYNNFGYIIGTTKQSYTTYNIGIGIGLKIDFLEVLDINFQTGYAFNNITDSFYTGLAGEIGLYYQL